MSNEQTAKKERFLREVERQLLRKGLDSEMMEDGILNVKWHGQLLCDVDGDGMVCFPSKTVMGVDADASLQTVIQIASQVREYMPIFARAPALKAIGLEGSYKILADFGDAVLAGRLGKKGANFVTWEWDFDRNGVRMGHYFIEDYEHWTRIRTNNVIERLNREIRRRTRVVGTFPDGNSALMLVCARLRHVAGTQWGNKKYMNMKHLEAALDGAFIAG